MIKGFDITFLELNALASLFIHKSVRSASRHLRLKPSHLSKILVRLEAKVGQRLFNRTHSGLIPTIEGIAAVTDAKNILGLAEKSILLRGKEPEMSEPDVVTIGSLSFLNRWLLAPSLMKTTGKSLERWRLLDLPPDQLLTSALQGGFDIALNTNEKVWPRTWDVKVVGNIQWEVYSRLGHPLGKKTNLTKLISYPFVIPSYWQKDGYSVGDDLFPIPISERIRGTEVSTADTSAVVCSMSDQVAFLPNILGSANPQLQRVAVAEIPLVERNLVLACKSDRVSNAHRLSISRKIKDFMKHAPFDVYLEK